MDGSQWKVIRALRAGAWHAWILISEGRLSSAALWGGDCRVAKVGPERLVTWSMWVSSDECPGGGVRSILFGNVF